MSIRNLQTDYNKSWDTYIIQVNDDSQKPWYRFVKPIVSNGPTTYRVPHKEYKNEKDEKVNATVDDNRCLSGIAHTIKDTWGPYNSILQIIPNEMVCYKLDTDKSCYVHGEKQISAPSKITIMQYFPETCMYEYYGDGEDPDKEKKTLPITSIGVEKGDTWPFSVNEKIYNGPYKGIPKNIADLNQADQVVVDEATASLKAKNENMVKNAAEQELLEKCRPMHETIEQSKKQIEELNAVVAENDQKFNELGCKAQDVAGTDYALPPTYRDATKYIEPTNGGGKKSVKRGYSKKSKARRNNKKTTKKIKQKNKGKK